MFERPETGENALLLFIEHKPYHGINIEEFHDLVGAAGAEVAHLLTANVREISSHTYIGQGKVEELRQLVKQYAADVVVCNIDISPVQERNLEKELSCRVLSFSGLILDIFAQRALSFEGKCQVELAQLRHLSTRLVRGWTHLERQKGGIGLRGPGEKQLELDRRILLGRIKAFEGKIAKIRTSREQGRAQRLKKALPTVTLVGYTNAGKSTLFNALTNSHVFVKDQLFATLDTTMRQISVPGVGRAILADTVGFIRGLPHELIDAFAATLEETASSQLLLHVVDSSADDIDDLVYSVEQTLAEIGAAEVPTLFVMNKIDNIDESPKLVRNKKGLPSKVYISAAQQEGFDLLAEAIGEILAKDTISGMVSIGPTEAALRASLYEQNVVEFELLNPQTHGWDLEVRMTGRLWQNMCRQWPKLPANFIAHEHR